MQVNSIQTVFQNEENRTKAKYIGAGTLLSAGSAFLATKASKNAQDTFKMSNRIAKTAAASWWRWRRRPLPALLRQEL